MDLMEIARTRHQIQDLSIMVLSLKQELARTQKSLAQINLALTKKKYRQNKELLHAQGEYQRALKEIQETMDSTLELIDQLRYRLKPRAQLQITQKLF